MIPKIIKRLQLQEAVGALIMLAAFFALMNVIARYLGDGFEIFQQTYLRAAVAFVLAAIVFRKSIRWHIISKLPAKEWRVLGFRGVIYFLGVALAAYGAIHSQISHVSFISAAPFVPLLGFLLLREKMTWWKMVFTVGSFVGVLTVAVVDIGSLTGWNYADLVIILSTLLLALSFVGRKWHNRALNNKEITTLLFLFGAVGTFIISIAIGESLPLGNWTPQLLGVLIFTGIVNVVGLQLLNFGFGKLDAVRADNILTLKTAFGVLFGFLFYQEIPDLRGLIGGLIIIACVVGMNAFSGRAAKFEAVEQPVGNFK